MAQLLRGDVVWADLNLRIGGDEVLHEGADDGEHVFERSGERGFLPTPGVPADTHTVDVGATVRELHAVIGFHLIIGANRLLTAEDQVVSPNSDVHPGGELVALHESDDDAFCFSNLVRHGVLSGADQWPTFVGPAKGFLA